MHKPADLITAINKAFTAEPQTLAVLYLNTVIITRQAVRAVVIPPARAHPFRTGCPQHRPVVMTPADHRRGVIRQHCHNLHRFRMIKQTHRTRGQTARLGPASASALFYRLHRRPANSLAAVGYLPVWLADHTLDLIRAQFGRQNINKIADLSGLQAAFICPQNSGDRDIRGQPVRLYPAIFNTKFRINFFQLPLPADDAECVCASCPGGTDGRTAGQPDHLYAASPAQTCGPPVLPAAACQQYDQSTG